MVILTIQAAFLVFRVLNVINIDSRSTHVLAGVVNISDLINMSCYVIVCGKSIVLYLSLTLIVLSMFFFSNFLGKSKAPS